MGQKQWELLKPVYLTRDAQALTEFAVFGGILLVVLSFFLAYALRMDVFQDLRLKVFRMALNEAYDPSNLIPDRPDNASSIILYKDRHIPDPRNIAARGSYSTVGASAAVVWGNSVGRAYDGSGNLRQSYLEPGYDDFSRIKFIINDQQRTYRTQGGQSVGNYIEEIWVNLNGEAVPKSWADLHCYQPDPRMEKRVNVYLSGIDTLLVSEIGIDMNNNGGIEPDEWMQIIKVNGSPNDGDPIQEVAVLASQLGEIQPYHLGVDYIKQYADNDLSTLEGLILGEDSKSNRQNITGTFIETTNVYTSQAQYNLDGTRTIHKMKTQLLGTEEIVFEPAQKNGAFAWRTQPKAR